MSRLSLSFLGGFEARLYGEALTGFSTDKVRLLLAYLAVEGKRPHRRETLAGLLWPGYTESSARASLRHALANLRQVLGDTQNNPPFLLVEGETIQLNPLAETWVDVRRFEALVTGFGEQDRRAALEEALGLYRGGFLEGCSLADSPEYEGWVRVVRQACQSQAVTALEELKRLYEAQGEVGRAIQALRQSLAIEAWREESHCELMRLLALAGQRSAALAQYEVCKRSLKAELGVEPAAETVALYERIRVGEVEKVAVPAMGEGSKPSHNLPRQLTSFIGREAEIEQITQLLAESALVSLVGPGGVGKTRLAIQVAEAVTARYPQGICFIDLAAVREPANLVPAVVQTLGISTEKVRSLEDALTSFLRNRHTLLVFDNCEHLIKACAALVIHLLQECPQIHLLATSQEELKVRGERVYRLQPMAFLKVQEKMDIQALRESEAVRLFEDRAQAVQHGFVVSERNAPFVAAICCRLDGIPLALELAAARLRVLSIEQVELMLADRFRLLMGGKRDALPRQQTLLASIEWSHELLSGAERILFRRLSVFAGGYSLEGAQQVCAGNDLDEYQIIELLDSLASKSLLLVEPGELPRYRMLETVREYAHQKLVEAGELTIFRDHHLDYYVKLSKDFEKIAYVWEERVSFYKKLDPEVANLRLAIRWAFSSEDLSRVEKVVWLNVGLLSFFHDRDLLNESFIYWRTCLKMLPRGEPRWALARARANLTMEPPVLSFIGVGINDIQESLDVFRELGVPVMVARGQATLAYYLVMKGKEHCPEARQLAWESVAMIRAMNHKVLLANILVTAWYTLNLCETEAVSRKILEESYALARESGNYDAYMNASAALSELAIKEGDYAWARNYYLEQMERHKTINCQHGVVEMKVMLGIVAYFLGDYLQMETAFREAVDYFKDQGIGWIFYLRNLAIAYLRQGKYGQAVETLKEFLNTVPKDWKPDRQWVWDPSEWVPSISVALVLLAGVYWEMGFPEQSARLVGFAAPHLNQFIHKIPQLILVEYRRIASQVKEGLGKPDLAAAWEVGETMSPNQALEYTLELMEDFQKLL